MSWKDAQLQAAQISLERVRTALFLDSTHLEAVLRALANLALGAQVIGPLALTLIGLFFCQSRAEVILGGQTSLLSLFGLSFSGFLL